MYYAWTRCCENTHLSLSLQRANYNKQLKFWMEISVAFAVQSFIHVQLFATPMDCSTPGFSIFHHLPELAQTHVHWVGDAIQPSSALSPSSPPSFNLSQHQSFFSNELALLIRWPKYWSFSFSISPSNEYSGLISFRMDWLDLLAVQGTLKSVLKLQFKSINSSVLSHFYDPTLTSILTTGKTIALTIGTFVGKEMSHLFNMLSRFVIAFLQRSKHLWISWLKSPFKEIL